MNYLIDPKFTKVNRLLVLSFERFLRKKRFKDYRDSFSSYYVPNV